MKKSFLLLALNALEVKLLNARQQFKRDKLDDDVEVVIFVLGLPCVDVFLVGPFICLLVIV